MSSDRELLEAAARAAGIVIKRSRLDDPMTADMLIIAPQPNQTNAAYSGWNPLTDDGDALRLAVKLRMNLFTGVNGCDVESGGVIFSERGLDAYAATRRCIVRAAASMAPQEKPE